MAHGLERVVDSASLLLGAVKFVADREVVRRDAILTFQLEKIRVGTDPRQRNRLAITLGQFTGSLKIVFARVIFGETEPGLTKPITLLFGRAPKFVPLPPFRPT